MDESSLLSYIDPKLRTHHKRLVTKFPDDRTDMLALCRSRCLVISSNVRLPYIVAGDFVDYSKSIEKPLSSVRFVNLEEAALKFRSIFRDSVDRVANFTRNILAKQMKNNAAYGFAILRDTSQGRVSPLYQIYVPLHEIIASLKNPHNDLQLQEMITHWDQHLSVETLSKDSTLPSAPPSKQVGCRKVGDSIGPLQPGGKDRLYLARCYLYGSAVTMAPNHVEHPISWFRTNFPRFLNFLKLSLCAELESSTTTQWVDNSITREIEAKVLPKVTIPPLLDGSKAMSHNDWKQHLDFLRRENIMAIHILPPCRASSSDPSNPAEDDAAIDDMQVRSTEDARDLVWSVLRGVQACCSASLVFPPYRLKAYCSLTPSPLTARCHDHVVQTLSFQPPPPPPLPPLHDSVANTAATATAKVVDFPFMTTTLPHSALVAPPGPSICVLLPGHNAMWRFDFPPSLSKEEQQQPQKEIEQGRRLNAVKLQLYTFLHHIIFTCTNSSSIPLNTVLVPSLLPPPDLPSSRIREPPPAAKKRRAGDVGVSSKLKLGYEVGFRCNFESVRSVATRATTSALSTAATTVMTTTTTTTSVTTTTTTATTTAARITAATTTEAAPAVNVVTTTLAEPVIVPVPVPVVMQPPRIQGTTAPVAAILRKKRKISRALTTTRSSGGNGQEAIRRRSC